MSGIDFTVLAILNLWETDIQKEQDKCIALISMFVSNNGRLDNYHSFNYSYENYTLQLNENLIIPYQEMHSSDYAHLIKQIS